MCKSRGYHLVEFRNDNLIDISRNGHTNHYYLFGGKDEGSQDLIQGVTLAGILFDEVALMPESFVNQGIGRCSVEGAKLWFNCNPDNPYHFVKTDIIDKSKELHILHIHFVLDDNLSLSEETKERYRRRYTGIFFKRFILGLWVMAEGAIYDMYDENKHIFDELPIDTEHRIYRRYITIDYGTTNPCVFLEIIDDCQGHYYITRERYYDSKDHNTLRQKDDAEHADDLVKFVNTDCLRGIIIDPSAASFKVAIRKRGFRTIDADNEVLDGIRLVATLLSQGRLYVHRSCINTRKELAAYTRSSEPGCYRYLILMMPSSSFYLIPFLET
jgi:PBSX family phage terminase large subunit